MISRIDAAYHASVYVAGDVGGTKALLALVDGDVVREETYQTQTFASLEELLDEFFNAIGVVPPSLSLALAGPVRGERARVTNLDWDVDGARLRDRYGFGDVRLVNDLAAIRDAIPSLPRDSMVALQLGEPEPQGTVAVVAPGTGLGFAASGIASEAGHAAFAPMTERHAQLWSWLHEMRGFVSREDVCSGRGMPDLYRFLRRAQRWSDEPAELDTPTIVAAAIDDESSLCSETLELFVEILGGIAGDWALEVGATGGLYLAGGLATRSFPRLRGAFLESFYAGDRMGGFLRAVPVYVVLDARVALRGAMLAGTE